MRLRLIVPVLAVSLAGAAFAFQPEAGQPGQPGQPGQGGGGAGGAGGRGGRGGQPSVEGGMKAMQRAGEALQKDIADPSKRDANLKLVYEMQRACAVCKVAPMPGSVLRKQASDADRTKATESMRVHLTTLMRLLLDLEDAIAANKTDEAKLLFEKIGAEAEKGHTEFKVGEE